MGQALAGRGTMLGPLSTDWSGMGAGRSATVRWRRMPGASWAASVNAAWPVRTVGRGGMVSGFSAAPAKLAESANMQTYAEILRQAGSNERTEVRFTGPLSWVG